MSEVTEQKEIFEAIYSFLNKVMKVRFQLAEIKENELNLKELKQAEIDLEIFLSSYIGKLKKED